MYLGFLWYLIFEVPCYVRCTVEKEIVQKEENDNESLMRTFAE